MSDSSSYNQNSINKVVFKMPEFSPSDSLTATPAMDYKETTKKLVFEKELKQGLDKESSIVGIRYVQHYDDKDDEDIIIDLEKEHFGESQSFEYLEQIETAQKPPAQLMESDRSQKSLIQMIRQPEQRVIEVLQQSQPKIGSKMVKAKIDLHSMYAKQMKCAKIMPQSVKHSENQSGKNIININSFSSISSYQGQPTAINTKRPLSTDKLQKIIVTKQVNDQKSNVSTISYDNTKDKEDLHKLRLQNAEQRALIMKLQRKVEEQEKEKIELKNENERLNKLRDQDLQLFNNQDQQIRTIQDDRAQLHQHVYVQEEQLCNLKQILEKTINVKLEYEYVIKQLLLDDTVKGKVVNICMMNRNLL